ncbi:MAG: PQQ-binding-like beta-propeller repeat protein [Bacteroidota bacterium]
MNYLSRVPFLFAFAVFTLLNLSFSCTTDNWPQFRGPDNSMIVEGDLPTEWGKDHNVAWTSDVDGDSWSSPVIWGDKIFIVSAVAEKVIPPPERQEGQPRPDPSEDKRFLSEFYRWEVSCVDLNTGEELWKKVAHQGNPRIKKHRLHNYAGESPVTDGKRLYVYFGMTGVYCYDLDGSLLWEKDLGAYETLRGWGTGSSPVLFKDLLYVQVDNEEKSFLVALDTKTGDEVWKANRDEATNYSTPIIWKNSIRSELVVGGKKARAYDPATGDLIWELHMAGHYNIASAVADPEFLYIGNSGYRDIPSTLFCVKAGAEGDITPAEGEGTSNGIAWSNLDAPLGRPSPLLYDGLLYLLSSRGGEFTCVDAATGDQMYQEKIEKVGITWASPWAHGDKIYFYDEKGVTQVIKAGKEFELLYQNKLEDKFWASVAVKEDHYIFKGVEKMYCVKNLE